MIKKAILTGLCSLGLMVTAHAANIDIPGGDAMVPDTAYESYSYNSADMDLVEAQFRRRSGPVVAQTVRDGRRTLEQAKSYMEGNAKFLKRQANQSTVFIFDNDTQHIRFSMPYPSLENKVINDGTNPVVNVVNGSPQYYIKSMNANIVVDVDHKTTYTDRAFTYKTVKNGHWQQKYGIMTSIPGKEAKTEPRTSTGVEFSLPNDMNHVYRVNIINRGNGNPDHINYAEGALANYVIPSVEDTKAIDRYSNVEKWGNFEYRVFKNSKRKADYEPTSYGEETRVYEGGGIVQLVKRRPIFPTDEKHFYAGAFATIDTVSRKYPYLANDNATIWNNGVPAFSGSIKFDNGTNYTYFTIRDDQYVYSIEVAYKANEVKRSYHDIRNMVEMARLISRQNKQEFPVLKHLWEADVFKLP